MNEEMDGWTKLKVQPFIKINVFLSLLVKMPLFLSHAKFPSSHVHILHQHFQDLFGSVIRGLQHSIYPYNVIDPFIIYIDSTHYGHVILNIILNRYMISQAGTVFSNENYIVPENTSELPNNSS